MRKTILPTIALLALAYAAQTADAGPLRRVARGLGTAVKAPLKVLPGKRVGRGC